MNTPSADYASQEAARLKAIYNDRKRSNRALNQAVLAEMCGWSSQGTVSQYMNGGLELNLEALLKFAAALAFDPAEVSPRLTGLISRATTADASQLKEAELTPGVALPSQAFRRAPIKGIAQLGPDGYWDALETSDGWIDIPTNDPQAYSLRVKGDSMIDAMINDGDLIELTMMEFACRDGCPFACIGIHANRERRCGNIHRGAGNKQSHCEERREPRRPKRRSNLRCGQASAFPRPLCPFGPFLLTQDPPMTKGFIPPHGG